MKKKLNTNISENKSHVSTPERGTQNYEFSNPVSCVDIDFWRDVNS
jgi:hypothetical protein